MFLAAFTCVDYQTDKLLYKLSMGPGSCPDISNLDPITGIRDVQWLTGPSPKYRIRVSDTVGVWVCRTESLMRRDSIDSGEFKLSEATLVGPT